jgi:tetratricopeptide (TPR) repeat protein
MRFQILSTLAFFTIGSAIHGADTDVAHKAEEILRTNCYRCHGQNGTIEGGMNYVIDLKTLVARKKIVPGNPAKSRLIKRVRDADNPMPPSEEKVRPSNADLEILEAWVRAGAPDLAPASTARTFITDAEILRSIDADVQKLDERRGPFARYFTITHLHNLGLSDDELETYRQGLSKLVNSLSWEPDIAVPQAIDAAKTILRIDLRNYRWSAEVWQRIIEGYPYGIIYRSPAARSIAQVTSCDLPFMRADWFVFAASRPPLYYEILQLPRTDRELERLLNIDVAANIEQERVARAGFNGSGVSRNNRLIERHRTAFGAYWKSYDFAGNTGRQNLFEHPLGPGTSARQFQQDGGEIIFNLPNGLQAYLLINGKGERIDEGPTKIVSVKNRPDPTVINGVSCMFCHARGMIDKSDQIRAHVEKNAAAFSDTETQLVRGLYPAESYFRALLQQDAERFRRAVEQSGARMGRTEPVAALAQRFEIELDLPTAAAELGLQPAGLRRAVEQSTELAQRLGVLNVSGGTVQRQVFVAEFPDLVPALGLGVSLFVLNQTIARTSESIRFNPKNAAPYFERGNAFFAKAAYDAAIADYTEAIRLGLRGSDVYRNRGMAHAQKEEFHLAIVDYDEAIRLEPRNAGLYHNRALAHAQRHNDTQALADLDEAVRLEPGDASLYSDRGFLRARKGEYDPAIADFDFALRLQPGSTAVLLRRGDTYRQKGDHAKALGDYTEAVRLSPRNAHAHDALAWLRATAPEAGLRNGNEAIEHATRACELTGWKTGKFLATLAAGYAECGRFEDAVTWQKKALQTASDDQVEQMRSALNAYQSRQPYRNSGAR